MTRRYLCALAVVAAASLTGCHGDRTAAAGSAHHLGNDVAAHGTIVGAFRVVGGPAPGLARPLRGTIAVHLRTSQGNVVTTAAVPKSGRFSIGVVPGRYLLVGTTPQITGAGGGGCPAFHPVTVVASKTVHVRVTCEVP